MGVWKGRSRGNVLGYQIFVYLLRTLGLKPAYLLLRLVALYFVVGALQASKHSYKFYKQRLSFPGYKALLGIYRNHYVFGQTLIDKVAFLSGLGAKYTFDFDGKQHLEKLVNDGRGAILISAHIGNWEIASDMLKDMDIKVNVVMMDAEYQQIKSYLNSVTGERNYNIIAIKQDMSHIFQISNALSNNEFICMHGDRYVEGSTVVSCPFLGEEAYFPAGPFSIAKRLKVPAVFVYAMKGSDTHYHLNATRPIVYEGRLTDFVLSYVHLLEEKVKKFPYQWFNYYDFWDKSTTPVKVKENA